MKKGISIWAFPEGTKLREAFRLARGAGFDGVEIAMAKTGELTPDTTEEELLAIRSAADDAGIELFSVATAYYWNCPFTGRETGKDAVTFAKAQLRAAKTLGCNSILVVPGFATKDVPYDKAWDLALSAMRELAPVADSLGVDLGIENVWSKFLLSPLEMRAFVDACGVRAYFDAGNVLVSGYPDHWIDILGNRICKVHIKDFKTEIGNITGFADLLRGDVDFPAVMAALRRVGYDGWVTAEVGAATPETAEWYLGSVSAAMDRIFKM